MTVDTYDDASKRIEDVMVAMPDGCMPDNDAAAVLEVMEEADMAYLPVVESFTTRRPTGIVARGALERVLEDRERARVTDAEVLDVPQVRWGTTLEPLFDAPVRADVVLVVDAASRCVGFVEMAGLSERMR